MIISCNSCNKKFEIDSTLIHENGRLLQCGNCGNKWFYKKDKLNNNVTKSKLNNDLFESKIDINEKSHKDLVTKADPKESKSEKDSKNKNISKIKKNNSINKQIGLLSVIIVFIISIAALIILLDTFKSPLNAIIPNLESILYNLYISIDDIFLFFKDLI